MKAKRKNARTLKNRQIKKLEEFNILIDWITEVYGIGYIEQNKGFVKAITRLYLTKGPSFTIARVKYLRLCLTRFLSNQTLTKQPFIEYSGDLPRLMPYRSWIYRRDKNFIKLAYTLLSIGKFIIFKPLPDFSSITEPITCIIPKGTISEICFELDSLIGGRKVRVEWDSFHNTSKGGPTGKALINSLLDLKNLPPKLIHSIKTLGGEKLSKEMDKLVPLISDIQDDKIYTFSDNSNTVIRKLSYIYEAEGKTRIIAMLDYWSQTCLKPLHNSLFELLRGIEQDCTFNQSKVKFQDGINICKDLSKATDRFPLEVQVAVLNRLLFLSGYKNHLDLANAWKDIMVGYPYTTPEGDKQVFYACGQPMGAYSSWALFSLCHHLLIRAAARKCGYKDFKKYYVLGDDSMIYSDKTIGVQYDLIMSTYLGVECSDIKSTSSESFMEFAKRYFLPEGEVTGFYTRSILETFRSLSGLLGSIILIEDRNVWRIDDGKIIGNNYGLLLKRLGMNKAYSLYSAKLIRVYFELKLALLDKSGFLIRNWLSKRGLSFSCNQNKAARIFIFELLNSLRLKVIIDNLIVTVPRINLFVNNYKTKLGIDNNILASSTPLVYCLIKSSNELMNEASTPLRLMQEARDEDILEVFKFTFLPNTEKLISKKINPKVIKRESTLVLSKLIHFLRKETLLVRRGLNSPS